MTDVIFHNITNEQSGKKNTKNRIHQIQAVDYIVEYRQDEVGHPKPSSIIKLGKGGEVKIIRE